MIHSIEARIKFNTLYVCAKCNKKEVGDTVRVDFRGSSTLEMKQIVDSVRATSAYMPNGWSYNGQFNCGCAKGGNS
jgi:hypothetical protein